MPRFTLGRACLSLHVYVYFIVSYLIEDTNNRNHLILLCADIAVLTHLSYYHLSRRAAVLGSMVMATILASHLIALLPIVAANCECGYTSLVGNDTAPYLFTDVIESDFLHRHNITLDTDWKPQNFTVSAAAGRGPYGMNFTLADVNTNPISNTSTFTGPGIFGGDPGLTLSVGGGIPQNGMVPTAEIDSTRTDLLYGSYRASMKLTSIPGTCSAFFWVWTPSRLEQYLFVSPD